MLDILYTCKILLWSEGLIYKTKIMVRTFVTERTEVPSKMIYGML